MSCNDDTLEQLLFKCLPSNFNDNNQFIVAIFLNFIETIHEMFEIQETLSLYELIEHIYFLIHRRDSRSMIYNAVYGSRRVGIVSIHDFYKFIRGPLIFYDVNDFINDPRFIFTFTGNNDINIDFIHVVLRFCETVLLFAVNGVIYDLVYICRFHLEYNQNPYVPLIGNYYNNQELRNDILKLQLPKNVARCLQNCTMVSDEIQEWFTHVFKKQYNAKRKLNSLHYVLQKNSDVHPRIKDVLHFCL